MKVRISKHLYRQVREDLHRPHKFAAERIGFITAKHSNTTGTEKIVLLSDYTPVLDEHYEEDYSVGARINSQAIQTAMQSVLTSGDGLFHVHFHNIPGELGLSFTDKNEIPPLVNSFYNVGPETINGILLLGNNESKCWISLPGHSLIPTPISVVGHPMIFFGRSQS